MGRLWTYLGVCVCSGPRFSCSITDKVKSFYKCANSIFRIEGFSDDMIKLNLVESHCVPLLTYAVEVIHISDAAERRKLRVAYNSLFRRIFGYSYRESVRELQAALFRPTWEELIDK